MSKSSTLRVAQMPPMPPMPSPPPGAPPAGAMPMGAPGMPPPPGAMPGGPMPGAPMPTMPMAAPGGGSAPDRPEVPGPLSSLSQILWDADAETQAKQSPEKSPQDLAQDIWQQYGGSADGMHADPGKVGTRGSQDIPADQLPKQNEATENERWKRLPAGKTIADITDRDKIAEMVQGVAAGDAREKTRRDMKEQGEAPPGAGGPSGPPGGAPPGPPGAAAASRMIYRLRLASLLDSDGRHELADLLDRSVR